MSTSYDEDNWRALKRIGDQLENITIALTPQPTITHEDFELAEAQSMAQQLYEVLAQISTSWLPSEMRRKLIDALNIYELYKDSHD